jgi:hypothetical protein
VTDVLDLIDGAIRDWEIGNDAMRWTPDPIPVEPPNPHSGHGHARVGGVPGVAMPGWMRSLPPAIPPYAPGSAELTALMPAICRWLAGNGFVPGRVPLHAVPVVSDRWIWCEVHAYDSAGRLVFDKVKGEVPTIVQRRPRWQDPPDGLWPWIATGDPAWTLNAWLERRLRVAAVRASYARRVKARRRRRR